jgi:hypothetical protein
MNEQAPMRHGTRSPTVARQKPAMISTHYRLPRALIAWITASAAREGITTQQRVRGLLAEAMYADIYDSPASPAKGTPDAHE